MKVSEDLKKKNHTLPAYDRSSLEFIFSYSSGLSQSFTLSNEISQNLSYWHKIVTQPSSFFDHALLPTLRTKRTWQLDPLILADSDFVKFITEQIDFF